MADTLWAAPPIAKLATLLPAQTILGASSHPLAEAVADVSAEGMSIWDLGVAAASATRIRAQLRFLTDARAGRTSASVVGVISPRIILPREDGTFTDAERTLIQAHEREHVARQDPRATALAAVLQTLCWFNPLAWFGAHVMRLDQELACDPAVLRKRPADRGLYARTLLKSQFATQSLPIYQFWAAQQGKHMSVMLITWPMRPGSSGLSGSQSFCDSADSTPSG